MNKNSIESNRIIIALYPLSDLKYKSLELFWSLAISPLSSKKKKKKERKEKKKKERTKS
jgi:hypothetical protein